MFDLCLLFVVLSSRGFLVDGFDVSLKTDGPVIIGGTINFWAEIHGAIYVNFRLDWKDNAQPEPHTETMYVKASKAQWNITYTKDYSPGKYEVELNVCESNLIYYWPCNKRTISYEITADLNGGLEILQNSTVKIKPYVSNHSEVEHKVILKDTDLNVLKENNFTVITFWLINCTYLGMTNGFTFRYNYTTADEDFVVKAIVVAAKLNETTNVTDTFPDTSQLNITLNNLNTTEKPRILNVTSEEGRRNYSLIDSGKLQNETNKIRNISDTLNSTIDDYKLLNLTSGKEKIENTTLETKLILMEAFESEKILSTPLKKDSYFTPWPDGSCNGSFIPRDPDKLYGYFHQKVKPRRPIQILSVDGNNWLKNGDLLNLTISFTGSQPYHHCIQFIPGEYNSTGNETCYYTQRTMTNKINIIHYFGKGEKHTVLFIIENSVSKTVTAVVVTNYKEKPLPQLSVVIVPLIFSVIAIISIVFGVAYYIQSINRGPIEVADFDFSASNDTEYKSFKGRLLEALSSAFTRSNLEEEQEEGPSWSPSRNTANKPRMFSNSSDSE